MMEVKFYDSVDDSLLKFAVIISQSNGRWVFCKHRERDTYEVPGGHREAGEDILEFGMLRFVEITEFAKELHSEIERVILMDELPENWTYPLIQPKLIEEWDRRGK